MKPHTLTSAVLAPCLAVALLLGSAPTASDASTTSARTVSGDQIVRTAKAQLGARYVWGATGPNTFDCSGLVVHVFAQHGITNIPRTSINQHRWARPVSRSQLRQGDLVFLSFSARNGRNGTDHVGIYAGNGRMVDASGGQGRVIERAIIQRAVTGYGRVPGVSAPGSATATRASIPAPIAAGTTRAEAARIVADTLGLADRPNPFGVTTEGGAVGAIHHAGIGLPYRDGTWRPHATLTRAQLQVWLSRADVTRAQAARIVAEVLGLPDRPNPFGVTTHDGAVGAVHHARIGLPYRDGTWRPHATLTQRQLELWMRRIDAR